jgi:3'(2'), 5'-bisphosphate nucleotidase
MINQELVKHILKTAISAGNAILEIYNSADFGVEMKSDNSPLTLADKAAHEVIIEGLIETGYPVLSEEGAKIPYEERRNWDRFWMVDPLDGTKEFIKKNGEFTVNIALIEDGQPIFGVVYAPVLEQLYYGGKEFGAFKFSPLERCAEHAEAKEVADEGGRRIEMAQALKLSCSQPSDKLTVVASRSHLNEETNAYIDKVSKDFSETEFISIGSSLKLVLVAEGKAHLYPRYAPTMEWDTAAGHAIAIAAGAEVTQVDGCPLVYNKEDLLNPYFVVKS